MKMLSFSARWVKWVCMPAARSNVPAPQRSDNGNGNGPAAASALAATLRTMRQLFILLIGLTVLLMGVVMIVLPGPSILIIPLGLAILSIEFAWARRWLAKFKSYLPKRKPKANAATGAIATPAPAAAVGVSSVLPSSSVETP
jgi:uncharacterized protein (TIGR02611 family)